MISKTNFGYFIVAALIAATTFTVSPSIAATKTQSITLHKAGRVAATIPNTILSGTTAPKSTVGLNGDFYIDFKAMNFYGPKANLCSGGYATERRWYQGEDYQAICSCY